MSLRPNWQGSPRLLALEGSKNSAETGHSTSNWTECEKWRQHRRNTHRRHRHMRVRRTCTRNRSQDACPPSRGKPQETLPKVSVDCCMNTRASVLEEVMSSFLGETARANLITSETGATRPASDPDAGRLEVLLHEALLNSPQP